MELKRLQNIYITRNYRQNMAVQLTFVIPSIVEELMNKIALWIGKTLDSRKIIARINFWQCKTFNFRKN